MNGLLTAITERRQGLIGMLPPDEMGVLYDYGSLLLKDADYPGPTPTGVTLSDASWHVTTPTGGKKVSIKSLSVTTKDGQTDSIQRPTATPSPSPCRTAPIMLNPNRP